MALPERARVVGGGRGAGGGGMRWSEVEWGRVRTPAAIQMHEVQQPAEQDKQRRL